MHLLDDLDGLSTRAQHLLQRTGRRAPLGPGLETLVTRVELIGGAVLSAPPGLAVRREWFVLRFGGLRYTVRHGLVFDGERHDVSRGWDYDLGSYAWPDSAGGWFFEWVGERVSRPVRYVIHTDGRVGAEDGSGDFLEIAPSVPALIESHALIDELAQWDLCWWGVDLEQLDGTAVAELADVPEASGPTLRWRISPNLAVRESQVWTRQQPRPWRATVWARGAAATSLLRAQSRASGRA